MGSSSGEIPRKEGSSLENHLPQARAGSQQALGEVLQASRRYLLWIAQREFDPDLLPKAGASDMVQETLLDAHRDFGTFRGKTEAELLSWLRALLLHNLSNFARQFRTTKRSVGRERSLDCMGERVAFEKGLIARTKSPSQIISARQQAEVAEQLIQRLPEDHRRVIHLWQKEEKSFEEIGALMNRSPHAARMLWVRAMENLQHALEAFDGKGRG